MNRRLRARHLRTMGALAIALPLGLGVAISARKPIPTVAKGLGDVELEAPLDAALDLTGRFGDSGVHGRMWPATAGRGAIVELTAEDDLAQPDILLYWGAHSQSTDGLAGDEFMLGSFFGRHPQRFRLPAEGNHAQGTPPSGRLILYSLAHHEVVAAASLEGLGD